MFHPSSYNFLFGSFSRMFSVGPWMQHEQLTLRPSRTHQVAHYTFDEAKSRSVMMSLALPFGALRTRELRELLEDEDKIGLIIRRSEKVGPLSHINLHCMTSSSSSSEQNKSLCGFSWTTCGPLQVQRLQRAAEKMLVSNQKLAKVSLSQKPQFRDVKLLLAMRYKELDKLRSIIQAKQEQLGECWSTSLLIHRAALTPLTFVHFVLQQRNTVCTVLSGVSWGGSTM